MVNLLLTTGGLDKVSQATNASVQLAKGIQDYGITIIICAIFLILSSALMISCFVWFKNLINGIISNYTTQLIQLNETVKKSNKIIEDLADGLIPETQLRIKTTSNTIFDLALLKTIGLVKRILVENNIVNKPKTEGKIHQLVQNLFEDINSKFDVYRYQSNKLSHYTEIDNWVKQVSESIESEIYNDGGYNEDRCYTNIKMIYDNIKLDFYHNLNK